MEKFLHFIVKEIWHAAPILATGAAAIAIIFERFFALAHRYKMRGTHSFFAKVHEMVMSDRIGEATALCDQYPNKLVAHVVKEGLIRAHQPEELIRHGLELAVGESTQEVDKRTQFLSTLANVATLFGLFGTIVGLTAAFEAVGTAAAAERSALLAAGISTSMNATLLGLGVAIPTMLAYSFLMNMTNRLHAEIEHAAVRVMDVIQQRYFSTETAAAKPESRRAA